VLGFHHYDKIPEKITLKCRKTYVGSVSDISVCVTWLHCQVDHHDTACSGVQLLTSWKPRREEREREEGGQGQAMNPSMD
jgi:hypothetical protein